MRAWVTSAMKRWPFPISVDPWLPTVSLVAAAEVDAGLWWKTPLPPMAIQQQGCTEKKDEARAKVTNQKGPPLLTGENDEDREEKRLPSLSALQVTPKDGNAA